MPPEAPTSLTGTKITGGIRLNWTNNALNATGITVQRATDSAFTANLTTFDLVPTAVSYVDTTGVVGTTYYFRVVATNTVGGTVPAYPTSNATSVPIGAYPTIVATSNPSNTATVTR